MPKLKQQALIALLTVALWPLTCGAEPVLDFTPDNGAIFKTTAKCEQGGCERGNQTRFATLGGGLNTDILEVVRIDGVDYIHQIMGDPADGFIQEVYVEKTSTKLYYDGFGCCPTGNRIAPVGAFLGDLGSKTQSNEWSGGNGSNPLNAPGSIISGNGSANPNKVIMRQVLNSGGMLSEFLKDKLDRKPVTTLLLNTPDITNTVVIDMRNSGYSDMDIAGVVVNTMEVKGGGFHLGENPSFNLATDAQDSIIDAGRYTYTETCGTCPGGSGGTYNYINGEELTSAEMQAIDWSIYWDPFEDNPWTQYELHESLVGPNRPTPY